MIPRAAIAIAVAGVLLAYSVLRRGPSLSTTSRPLRWSTAPLDAGEVAVEFSVGGVEFIRAEDAEASVLPFGVLQRGDRRITLEDLNSFDAVEVRDGRLWAVGEETTEGGSGSIELLLSEDEGKSFEWRASVPKPYYLANFEAFTVNGDELALVMSIDDEFPMIDEWIWPWWTLDVVAQYRPTIGPGRFVLRSKNAGKTWRLERSG